jgi:hypothetical protein
MDTDVKLFTNELVHVCMATGMDQLIFHRLHCDF